MDEEHLDAGPEVFETSDVESVEDLAAPEEESNSVDRRVLDPKQAKSHFEHSVISESEEGPDFLGSLSQGRLTTGYVVRRANETSSQKLARIQAELAELQADKVYESEAERLTLVLEGLAAKQEPTNSLYGERIKDVFAKLSEKLSLPSVAQNSGAVGHSSSEAEILDLEKRLLQLEESVGVADLQSSSSIRNHVSDLARKVDVLYDPEFDLTHIKSEIKRISKEMDDLNAKRRVAHLSQTDIPPKSASTPFDAKVNSIYEVLPEIERTLPVVPQLMARLKTLHRVHADLAHSVGAVSEIDKTIQSLYSDMKAWSDNLDQVNSAIDKHAQRSAETRSAVEKKIQTLEEKFSQITKS